VLDPFPDLYWLNPDPQPRFVLHKWICIFYFTYLGCAAMASLDAECTRLPEQTTPSSTAAGGATCPPRTSRLSLKRRNPLYDHHTQFEQSPVEITPLTYSLTASEGKSLVFNTDKLYRKSFVSAAYCHWDIYLVRHIYEVFFSTIHNTSNKTVG
jgi:hypothetical protein